MLLNTPPRSLKPGLLLLLLSVVLSLFIYRDYGMAWDEQWQREIGEVSYDYIFKGDHKLDTFIDRDHGTGFELLLTFAEKTIRFKCLKTIYEVRHLLTHLFFLLGAFCGYVAALRLYKNQALACLAFFMLAFMPRIYAHSYFNTKDVPFMAACSMFFMVSQWAFHKNKPSAFLCLGLMGGYAASIRLQGILLFCIISVFLVIDCLFALAKRERPATALLSFLLFATGFCTTFYVCWPTLWAHPIDSLKVVFESLSHYSFIGNLLLNGKIYAATDLPWFYVPLWFGVTVPVLWIALGVAGFMALLLFFLKKPLTYIANTADRQVLLHAGCFVPPVMLIILLHSVIYDDWRHLYFIYPGFVLTAIFLMDKLLHTKLKWMVWLLSGIQVLLVVLFMFINHPFQNIYFNELISRRKNYIHDRYELDYWGTSFKSALEYLAAHDTSRTIVVNEKWAMILNMQLLPEKDFKRFRVDTTGTHMDYNLELFRGGPLKSPKTENTIDIEGFNNTLIRITKLKKD